MKKILFSLVCLLTCFSFVYAKTQIEYDWGKFEEFDIKSANIYKGNLSLFKRDNFEWRDYFDVYKDNGKSNVTQEVPQSEISFYVCGVTEDYYVFNDFLVSIVDNCGDYYQNILDDDLNVVKTIELDYFQEDFPDFFIGENDKYYYIGMNFFDKTTNELVDILDVLFSDPLMEQLQEQCNEVSEPDLETCNALSFEIISKYFKGTFLFPAAGLFKTDSGIDSEFLNIFVGDEGYAISLYDEDTDKYKLYFFDADANLTETILLDSYIEPYVLFKDNYFYIFEVKGKTPLTRDALAEEYYYSVTEYDYQYNKRGEFDLSLLTKEDAINLEANYGRGFWKILSTDDGFVMITKVGMGPMLSRDPDPQLDYAAIQKYSFIYNVETKENDNGDIIVDKESSKNGELVTYTVKPKEGYKLDKVIVTDESGNTIEIKDSSFTMPSANVIVEAIFVVENPNTSVFLTVAAACIITFVCYFFIVQKNMRVKQYE